ncbi:glycerophosphodiester phosphodiesterase [Acinetobacter sp. ANC 4779]|uniref:glycerophosphodiester phosphodiesterase n=1 Tax=Acinetobacter sp. ANC 4779 TaxID=2529848 RepID=UPI00103A5FAC|nr:glycerophosphodiester phosphodiesterase [Acinetobacter sp. ANC 4779]TCB49792.1 glycerophosphodiester phosphodiesterase [Acinetobacter sp. ANC 4779]
MRIIGHRGARGEAPENTLGGFQYIHDLGIRAVEFDVRQLKDDELVIMHDDNFLRTTGIDKNIYQCSSSELQSYNQASIWLDWKYFEVTPTLQQSLKIMQDFEHIEVEVKAVATMAEAEKLVLELEKQLHGFVQTVVITSFDLKIHQALKQQYSIFKRSLLIEEDIKERAIEQALELGCCQMGWMNQLATDEIIEAIQKADLNISVWTVNDIERARHLQSLGIEGLITDFPKMMLQHLSG